MEILIIVFLILLNGIFSMSEIALVSSKKYKLESAARKGNKSAREALKLSNNPNTFLSTVQIGITLIGILTGIFSGDKITSDLELKIATIAPLQPYAGSIAIGLVVCILTYFTIVFGELVPKRIGLVFPEKIASALVAPMNLVSTIARPFIWLLVKTNNFIFKLLGIKEGNDEPASEEEIASLIQESTLSGEIQEIEHHIVKRVFALGDRKVRELMTHRTELVWFDINDSMDTVRQKVKDDVHRSYPVGDKKLDNMVGMVYLKDLFFADFINQEFRLQDYIVKPLFVHENLYAYDLLEQLKGNSMHGAMIVDEYGSVEGIVTMYDVFDALVGDSPETLQKEFQIVKRNDNSWLVDGQFSFYELLEYLNLEIEEEEEGDFTTVGGLILHFLHHIPVAGEKIEWHNFEFEVVDMDAQRIDKVLITRITSTDDDAD